MKPSVRKQVIKSQASWVLSSDTVSLALTEEGGHMAPVVFYKDSSDPVEPYYVNPWHAEPDPTDEPVLRILRGDFFCMPFGTGPAWRGEVHRIHGETAHAKWQRPEVSSKDGVHQLSVSMRPRVRPGHVTKRLWLRDGENVVYVQHELSEFRGRISMGHHATLQPPARGRLRISTSPIQFGCTMPRPALQSQGGEYYALAPHTQFRRLDHVPTIWKDEPYADCSIFPARKGFVDVLSLYARVGKSPSWTAAVASEAGYLWFALKDPAMLPTTTMWMENQGRYDAPWNGRNCCIGLEEVCSYHAQGVKESVQRNDLSANGIPTSILLNPRRPTRINYIQGVVRIPKTFDRVRRARFTEGRVIFTAESGDQVEVSVCHAFLQDGRLS